MNQPLSSRICGTETEFGLQAYKANGGDQWNIANETIYSLLLECLPDGLYQFKQFLSNGARYYLDIGEHIEYATPECSFEEAVTYEYAGEELLLDGLNTLQENDIVDGFRLHKRVVDSSGKFWGAHESYSYKPEFSPENQPLAGALGTHLATRSVFTGAGRVTQSGPRISQKTASLSVESYSAAHQEGSRPLIDIRDEKLAGDRWRRLHVSCGDANVLPKTL